jgi:hypothetical protein
MPSSFFDRITLADKERVQSAVIAWIFSESNALRLSDELAALSSLFGITSDLTNIDSIESKTEWQNMDVLFLLKEKGTIRYVLVLENKIKCDLHDNQLNRYEQQIQSQSLLDKNGVTTNKLNPYFVQNPYLCLLTLLPTSNVGSWINKSYRDLFTIIENGLKNSMSSCQQNPDYLIAESYLQSIKYMYQNANQAIQQPSTIFSASANNVSNYIHSHKLSHVLQVYYFRNIMNTCQNCLQLYVNRKYSSMGQPISMRVDYGIQSNNAQISIDFKNGPLVQKYLNFGANGNGNFSIAFQNGTFKIEVAKDYWKKNPNDIRLLQQCRLLRNNGKNSIWDDKVKPGEPAVGWKVNGSRNGFARMSITQKIEKLNGINGNWYSIPNLNIEIIKGFKKCIDILCMIFTWCNADNSIYLEF